MTSILIVDDHKMIREGLCSLLEAEADMKVVGEAQDGRTAVRMAAELNPDVIVMDIQMPNLNGIDATRQAVAANPMVKIVCLSASNDSRFANEMLRAGAVGYIAKDSAFEDLITAIRAALAGKTFLSPTLTGNVGSEFRNGTGNFYGANGGTATAEAPARSAFRVASVREREVLQLIAEGKSTKEVAMALHLSVKTVETHRRNLMEKLNLDSVAELTKYAIREGITSL
jgi:DNA-binding NarL/FixJ family response regulator